jgi:hypothetical protein
VRKAELRPSGVGAPEVAIGAIARARCTREYRCNNIGKRMPYTSEEDCLQRVRLDWTDELNLTECPRGTDEGALAECVRELGETDCDSFDAKLDRWGVCSAGKLCDRGR